MKRTICGLIPWGLGTIAVYYSTIKGTFTVECSDDFVIDAPNDQVSDWESERYDYR